jgi:polyhydroxybutyrate depolymerase
VALCCACAGSRSPGCGLEPPVRPGESRPFSLKAGDIDREYLLHLPASYDPHAAAPLVLWIHGYTGTASGSETYSGASDHADTHGYIVVYPQSTGFRVNLPDRQDALVTSWNDLTCNASPGPEGEICAQDAFDYPCPPECGDCGRCNWCSCHDDVAFIDALLDRLESELCIDRDRVYATGMSNGGMFVHRLGCDMAERFAAIAPVAGTLARGFNCAPPASPRVSVLHIHGTEDDLVRADGLPGYDGFLYTPVEKVMDAWASGGSQGCEAEATPYPTSGDGLGEFACSQRADCETGAEVVSCYWKAEHVWPALEERRFGNDVIWNFFEKNPRSSKGR